MRDLTEEEIEILDNGEGECPFCGGLEFLEGPHGGLSVNIFCANEHCGAGFNVCPVWPGFQGQLIKDPPEPEPIDLDQPTSLWFWQTTKFVRNCATSYCSLRYLLDDGKRLNPANLIEELRDDGSEYIGGWTPIEVAAAGQTHRGWWDEQYKRESPDHPRRRKGQLTSR